MNNKSKKILAEISAGELLDKLSILEIKRVKTENLVKKKLIKEEYKALKEVQNITDEYVANVGELADQKQEEILEV